MGKRVLLVEDDILLATVQKKMVEHLGHSIAAEARSGAEAIRLANEVKPDIILMDIMLDGEMNGITAMQKIRNTSSVPVIYLSGSEDAKLKLAGTVVQPVGYLLKPVDKRELGSCIEKALVQANG